jgi:hypothetical protein
MYDYVRMGYWLVLPYSAIRGHPLLKIAPSGVVPQRDRRPRPIMDYSFNRVNQTSLDIAPTNAMQFGHCLPRILQHLAYANPKYGPPLMAKIDLADGYYRIPLSESAALELAVVLPADKGTGPLIGIPLSLPMGWRQSPPYFCAFTETCADLANTTHIQKPTHAFGFVTDAQTDLPHLAFDPAANWPYNAAPPDEPLQFVDVYLDDFMLIAQQPNHFATLQRLLHHLDKVFQDPDNSPRKSVVSRSKVDKGDATYSTSKRILGWDIDTLRMELTLPEHRKHRLHNLLSEFLNKSHVSKRKWQRLLGELRSMALAIHSAKYLFCILQQGLGNSTKRRIRLNSLIKHTLLDWVALLQSLHSLPVPITMLVPHAPQYWATADASIQGMGGLWLPTTLTRDRQPYVWRQAFPPHIQSRLVSTTNPTGDITNSDLELTALVLGHHTQHQLIPKLPYTCTYIATDNTPTHAWVSKGSPTTTGPPAFLLRQLARDCRDARATVYSVFTPGSSNTIADFLSRSFALSDSAVLQHLQHHFPVKPPWKLVKPPNTITSELNSLLLRKVPQQESQLVERPQPTQVGPYGQTFASVSPATHCSTASTTHYPCYKYSLRDTAWETWLPPVLRSRLEQWRVPYARWARRWPSWGSQIHASNRMGN